MDRTPIKYFNKFQLLEHATCYYESNNLKSNKYAELREALKARLKAVQKLLSSYGFFEKYIKLALPCDLGSDEGQLYLVMFDYKHNCPKNIPTNKYFKKYRAELQNALNNLDKNWGYFYFNQYKKLGKKLEKK